MIGAFQVDLGFMVHVSGIATQGAFDSQDWVTSYRLSYSEDAKTWISYYGISSHVWVGLLHHLIFDLLSNYSKFYKPKIQ